MDSETAFSANIERFTGFADVYDAHRPEPPVLLASLLLRIAGSEAGAARVVDLGAGTGLSTRYWVGKVSEVIGVEPTDSMRTHAESLGGQGVRYVKGFSHATGLEAGSADIVTCSQSLHWMEPAGTFAEAARILRPGGVFAAFDYDWPPVTGVWQVDDAYSRAEHQCRELEQQMGISSDLRQWDKPGHLGRMSASGAFGWTREVLLHHQETGDAQRLVGLFMSQGYVQQLRKHGCSDAQLGLDTLRQVAAELLPSDAAAQAQPWLWCSRLRVGVV